MKLHDENLCLNANCECHTDANKKVITPFPIELGNPYCCSHCAIRRDAKAQDNDLITIDWLLSIGAKANRWSAEQGENGYRKILGASFRGNNWTFRFLENEIPTLMVGEYVEQDAKTPHFTKKSMFRKLYQLLENKKLVENI